MSLPWKVRALLRVQALQVRLGLLPTAEKLMLTPHATRMAMGAPAALVGKVPAVHHEDRQVTTRDGASIRVRVYRSPAATRQPLLYVHGGGFVLGGIDACDHICRRLAHESGAVVASVEYRLAPDHPFPIPFHDVVDSLDWLVEHAAELDVDLDALVVGGDSGGGCLSAALAVYLRDEGRSPAGQLLIYPGVDLTLSLPGIHAYDGVGLTTQDVQHCVRAYIGDGDPTDPYASPWYADPVGLAPAFVFTVDHDPLKYEGVAYAEKLAAAGVPVTQLNRPDHVHGSLSLPRLYRGIDEVYAQMARFVRSVSPAVRP